VGIALIRTSPAHPCNVVYSYHTKGFNEIDQGAYLTVPKMDHGFARFMETDDHWRLVGYSAYDNNFDIEIYTPSEGEAPEGAFNPHGILTDEFTVCAGAFRYVESYEYSNANHYVYDTRHGQWVHNYTHMVWPDIYYGNIHQEGQIATDFAQLDNDYPYWIIFDGSNSVYRNPSTPLDIHDSWSYQLGGISMITSNNVKAYGYNAKDDLIAEIDLIGDITALKYSGQDYHTISRWSHDSDEMRTYFYNARNNRWQFIDLPEHYNIDGNAEAHYYMHTAGPENNVIFYSSPLDQILEYNLPDDGYVYGRIRGNLAYAAGSNNSVLFDGQTGQTAAFDCNIHTNSQNGLGTRSAVICDDDNNTLYGYSAISGTMTTQSFTEEPYICLDTGYVGIMTVYHNGNGYNKIYTYNSAADSWIEFLPDGYHQAILVGTKTAIVSRVQSGNDPDFIYAFDPERQFTGFDNNDRVDNSTLPLKCSLEQNYPNPFNPSTVILFNLPRPARVTITVYNLLGQKVKKLIDQEKAPGSYRVRWDGSNDAGETVATGLYMYRLQAGDEVRIKKMLMVK
jgi:hypothetical protein